MIIDFVKMQAAGNDYIYVECCNFSFFKPGETAKKLSRRRFSVGADGLVVMCSSEIADVKMTIYNADGSRAQICGNALRCVAHYMKEKKNFSGETIAVETDSGVKKITTELSADGGRVYSAEMGKARFISDHGILLTDVGNLHRVEICKNVDDVNFSEFPDMRSDLYNTEAVSIEADGVVRARVLERGSGETAACGSGACAIAAYCVYNGIFGTGKTRVIYPGGELTVLVNPDYSLMLTGDAELVYEGRIEL